MKITICICTFMRDALLRRLLQSLTRVDLMGLGSHGVDVLVVNNAPNPATRQLCWEAEANLPMRIRYVEEPAAGLVNARNRAVAEALASDADAIAFLDDDDVPDFDWLKELVATYVRSGADIVAGNRRYAELPPWRRSTAERRRKKSGDKEVARKIPKGAAACIVMIGRKILEELSRESSVFSPKFAMSGGEDRDFFLRAVKHGARIVVAEKSFITQHYENDRYTIRGVFRRGFKGGCSTMNLTLSHEQRREAYSLAVRAFLKAPLALTMLLVTAFKPRQRLNQIYRLGKALGMLYFIATGRSMKYY